MKDGNCCSRIDGDGWCRHTSLGDAQKSVERFLLIIRLYPGAHLKGLAVADVPFKYHPVGDQNICSALSENPAHFDEGELWIQRDRNAPCANDSEKPMETFPIVTAIDGNSLAW